MKLFGTLLCRNEKDIIEYNIKHHLQFLDGLIITDNNSNDGTEKILLDYMFNDDRVKPILHEYKEGYYQNEYVHRMIRLAKLHDATHVINIDADEFWQIDRKKLKELVKVYNIIKCESFNFLPERFKHFTKFKYRTTNKPFSSDKLSQKYNLFTEVNANSVNKYKCIHLIEGYKQIWMGNHDVDMEDKRTYVSDMPIFHYPVRNYKQFKAKITQGSNAYKNSDLPEGFGSHWRSLGKLLEQDERLFKQEYNLITGSKLNKRQLLKDGIICLK